MPRGQQALRIYRVFLELKRAQNGLPVQTIAQRLGVKPRTVYRDIELLRAIGFRIERTSGARFLLGGDPEHMPVPVPPEEALALHVARELMRPLRGSPIDRAFQSLYERLLGKPPAQQELFPYFRGILATRSLLAVDYAPHMGKLETICHAVQKRLTIHAIYAGLARSVVTARDIDPYTLYYDPALEALYLIGWCHLRRDLRLFAVHRFIDVRLSSRPFEMPLDFNVDSYLAQAFRVWREKNVQRVRLLVTPPLARWVAERRWHRSQRLRELGDGAVELTFEVEPTAELRGFILQLGACAQVLEPESLRAEVAKELERALLAYAPAREESVSPDDKVPLSRRPPLAKKGHHRAAARKRG